ncbi:MAG: hypothetical protein LBK42_13885 [Propionibacteriaceae bacterium]|jgi:hypothetical protein|nr:hypothetical protein [Propionibacteriaceae bacterium]
MIPAIAIKYGLDTNAIGPAAATNSARLRAVAYLALVSATPPNGFDLIWALTENPKLTAALNQVNAEHK